MPDFTFAHLADLHLGHSFEGLRETDERIGAKLAEATYEAFDRAVEVCVARNVDFVCVAGDVYNQTDRSLRAQVRFRDGLQRLSTAGIPTFVAHGNHDPLSGWAASLSWPPNVTVFGAGEVQSVPVKRGDQLLATVHGISYAEPSETRNLAAQFRRTGQDGFELGVLHANVDGDPNHDNYAPASLEDLRRSGFDYWALGHVHTHRTLNEHHPTVVYPGNTQGLSPRETGPRGFVVVRVAGREVRDVEFIPVSVVDWTVEDVSIDGLSSEQELLDRLLDMCEGLQGSTEGHGVVCRLRLVGRGPLHRTLAAPTRVQDLEIELRTRYGAATPFVWVDRLGAATQPAIDVAARRAANDFVGDLLKLIDQARQDPAIAEAVQSALDPLFVDDRRGSRALQTPAPGRVAEWLDRAEARCIDLLVDDRV